MYLHFFLGGEARGGGKGDSKKRGKGKDEKKFFFFWDKKKDVEKIVCEEEGRIKVWPGRDIPTY